MGFPLEKIKAITELKSPLVLLKSPLFNFVSSKLSLNLDQSQRKSMI